jgi:hypothetical protein
MTASGVADDRVAHATVSSDLAPALGRLAEAVLQVAATKLSHKTEDWIDGLEEYAASEGATGRAAYEGLKAHLLGKNPVWAAMKGAWWGASPWLRVVAVLVLMLFLVLAPVTLLLLVLGLLVAAIIAGIRAASR